MVVGIRSQECDARRQSSPCPLRTLRAGSLGQTRSAQHQKISTGVHNTEDGSVHRNSAWVIDAGEPTRRQPRSLTVWHRVIPDAFDRIRRIWAERCIRRLIFAAREIRIAQRTRNCSTLCGPGLDGRTPRVVSPKPGSSDTGEACRCHRCSDEVEASRSRDNPRKNFRCVSNILSSF